MSSLTSPKALVQRMTPTLRTLLEAAIGRAAEAGHDEVTIEHVLAQLARSLEGDVAAIRTRLTRDQVEALQERLEVLLTRLPSGSRPKPVFSPRLWQWFEDGWLYGSIEHGATRLRSGHLFWLVVRHPRRYVAELESEVEGIDAGQLERDLPSALRGTSEDGESRGGAADDGLAPIERRLALTALRRGANAVPWLEAFRARAHRDADAASTWAELFSAALEPEPADPSGALRIQHGPTRPCGADGAPPSRARPRFGAPCSDPQAVPRAARAADEAAAALRGAPPAGPPALRLIRSDEPSPDEPSLDEPSPNEPSPDEGWADERWADPAQDVAESEGSLSAEIARYATLIDDFDLEESARVLDEALASAGSVAQQLELRLAAAEVLEERCESELAAEQLRAAYVLSSGLDAPSVVRVCRRLAASDVPETEQREVAEAGIAAAERWLAHQARQADPAVALGAVALHLLAAGHGAAVEHRSAALAIAERHGLRAALLDAAHQLASAHLERGELARADAVLERALPEAQACGERDERLAALRLVALRNERRRARGLPDEPPELLLGAGPEVSSPVVDGLGMVVRALTRHPTAAEAARAGAFEPPSFTGWRIPDVDQLDSELLFGPRRDFECACGRYRGRAYEGLVCERCRVELIASEARSLRSGYVALPRRVLHPWYRLDAALLLGISERALAGVSAEELEGRVLELDLDDPSFDAHDGSPHALLRAELASALRPLSRGAAALMSDEVPVPPPDADVEGLLGVDHATLRRAYETILTASDADLEPAVAALFALFAPIDAPERALPPGPDAPDVLLANVLWRQSYVLFDSKDDFVRAVNEYEARIRDGAWWSPDETVLRAPAARITFRCWSGARELWPVLTLAAPNGASFTAGELLYAVSQGIAGQLRAAHAELHDHCFFEGLTKDRGTPATEVPLYHVSFGS